MIHWDPRTLAPQLVEFVHYSIRTKQILEWTLMHALQGHVWRGSWTQKPEKFNQMLHKTELRPLSPAVLDVWSKAERRRRGELPKSSDEVSTISKCSHNMFRIWCQTTEKWWKQKYFAWSSSSPRLQSQMSVHRNICHHWGFSQHEQEKWKDARQLPAHPIHRINQWNMAASGG